MAQKWKRGGSFPLWAVFPPVNYTLAGKQIMRWPGRSWWHSFSSWSLRTFYSGFFKNRNQAGPPCLPTGSMPSHFLLFLLKAVDSHRPQGWERQVELNIPGLPSSSLPLYSWHTTKPSCIQEMVFALNILGKAAPLSRRWFPNMSKGEWYPSQRLDQEVLERTTEN